MPKESMQEWLKRNRPPRVHITYDVETGGALETRDLPFVVGVMADLSGTPEKPLPALKDRKFVNIDRDNFDEVLKKMKPRILFKVDNTVDKDDTKLDVELRFESMADFHPAKVADQIAPLRKLLAVRKSLANLRSSLNGKEDTKSLLNEIMQSQDKRKEAGAVVGLTDEAKGT